MSKQSIGLRDTGPRGALAFPDAAMIGVTSGLCRLIPFVSSSAPGSRALLPEVWRNRSISKTPCRLSIQ